LQRPPKVNQLPIKVVRDLGDAIRILGQQDGQATREGFDVVRMWWPVLRTPWKAWIRLLCVSRRLIGIARSTPKRSPTFADIYRGAETKPDTPDEHADSSKFARAALALPSRYVLA
jgi:hypothetical protein